MADYEAFSAHYHQIEQIYLSRFSCWTLSYAPDGDASHRIAPIKLAGLQITYAMDAGMKMRITLAKTWATRGMRIWYGWIGIGVNRSMTARQARNAWHMIAELVIGLTTRIIDRRKVGFSSFLLGKFHAV